jgi:hypothetical protein
MAWWLSLLIGLALSVVSYLLAPKPKKAQPPPTTPLEDPTAEAGRPIPVLFGTHIFKDPNILWFGQKSAHTYEVDA